MIDRSNEAQSMYEKLKSHPSAKVGKKARHFVYSFQVISDELSSGIYVK
jgi:hypothetical protein